MLTDVVSDVEPVNGAGHRLGASDYPPRWSRVSRWVRGRAGWRCELCGVKNGPAPNVLTVHHLDGNKWNLLPWNLAALCQRCHFRVQWTVDFCQSTLSGIYPRWLREHVKAYNAWARQRTHTICLSRPRQSTQMLLTPSKIIQASPGRPDSNRHTVVTLCVRAPRSSRTLKTRGELL